MTITEKELDREMKRPMDLKELEDFKRQNERAAERMELIGKLGVAEYARIQAVGMVDHLQQFVRGKEESFRKYFVMSDDFHQEMHAAFWEETQLRFPIRQEASLEDDTTATYIEFVEYGVGLKVNSQYDTEGNLFGVLYEGYNTPNTRPEWAENVSAGLLGKVATGLAMS